MTNNRQSKYLSKHLWRKTILALFVMTALMFSGLSKVVNAEDSSFSEQQQEEIGGLIRSYLLKNPNIIIEAIEILKQNDADTKSRLFDKNFSDYKDTLTDKNAPFAGNPDGDVIVVEFFDFNCGYCKKAVKDVQALLEKDKNVKIIFHEMPILSAGSRIAAKWALAAHKQGKYFEYHVALMKKSGSKTIKTYKAIAKDLALDVAQMEKDANSAEIDDAITKSVTIAGALGIRGTPAFIIGNKLAPGYMGLDAMVAEVEAVRNN